MRRYKKPGKTMVNIIKAFPGVLNFSLELFVVLSFSILNINLLLKIVTYC